MAVNRDDITRMSGLEVLQAIAAGRVQHPSMADTLGFRLTEVGEGLAVIEGTTGPDYCNPNGTVHGAWPAALLDSCMGSAVHSMLPAGVGFTIVEIKIDFVRSITVDTGHVRAEGRVVRVGGQIGQSNGMIFDAGDNVLAKGSATCLILRSRRNG